MFVEMIQEQLSQKEIILEDKVFSGNGLYIEVDNNKNRAGDGYFKVFNNINRDSAKKVSRISICDSEYVYHNGKDGKSDFILSSDDKATLMKILSANNNEKWNEIVDKVLDKHLIPNPRKSYPLPDYNNLEYDKSKSKIRR